MFINAFNLLVQIFMICLSDITRK